MPVDEIDRDILSLLVEDARRTYDDIGGHVGLSAPAVKRRVDKLKDSGVLEGFTASINHGALGTNVEALIELFWVRGTVRGVVAEALRKQPNVVEAWVVTGDADTVVRVRAADSAEFDQVLYDLHQLDFVERTRSSIILKHLVPPR